MIEVKHLSKHFGPIRAVDDVSFTVKQGDILGFLGPNGAGKSTTMRMITGFLPPTGGTVVIGGCDILQDSIAARKKIGYLSETAPVYPEMDVTAFLTFCAEIRGFSGKTAMRRVDETIEKCFLGRVRRQTTGTLSKGYKQRVSFAQAILHDPEYLIMDEPTDGLDPNQKHEVRQMIRQMSARKAIILSTHILDEVDAVCNRAIIISEGRIQFDDTPEQLRIQSEVHGALTLKVNGGEASRLLAAIEVVEGVKRAELLRQSPENAELRVFPIPSAGPLADRIMNAVHSSGCRLESLFVEQGRLDEVFRKITIGKKIEP